ncbi:xanthine dehydrogenase family protein molybdopterin-binding subunit [Streptomyces sp. SL13]|uniref:Xanthine dehydrogenase family protein molybdopterin-binding subunit n=1 Tax=Streptantibioticus silvisoli TaxID=2705255 RepID=A0AA90HCV4_9ACTN|nr:xanthine dehydrogenase family protein molybdopterin-binding subunit [Streptantibioticus silvisoli]MDI5972577.1 xanthine dehydrogenase family protein molybdopterin-binding subunit [Streptantibioticus silvisoli]
MTDTTARPRTDGGVVAPAGGAVGTARTRLEGRDKVTGAARYAADVPFDGLAHGWLVLSTVARGRITSMDTAAVLGMPGVLGVVHHGNAPRLHPAGLFGPDGQLQLLQDDRVPHVGRPVALVVARTPQQARAGAAALTVTYAEEPHDTVFRAGHPAGRPAPAAPARPDADLGDVEAEIAAAPVVVDQRYTTPEEHHSAMEPHASMARWEDGRLEVVDSNQGSFMVARVLATLFGLDQEIVRVRAEHVGGGFGSKGVGPQLVLAVMAATLLRRPVRVALTRRQVFSTTGLRPATEQRLRLASDSTGRLRAIDHATAAFTSTIQEYVERNTEASNVMYAADAIRTRTTVVPLDLPTPGWMRGPGAAAGSFALESAMDELAQAVGVDPVELRLRNEPSAGPVSGLPFSSRNLAACLREGARRFGWADRDPRPGTRREGRWLLGTGVACGSYGAGALPSTAAITARADGSYTVSVGAADIGTGARTALALVAADALGVPPESVRMRIADSRLGAAWFAGGSKGTASWSWAVTAAAADLRERLASVDRVPPDGVTGRGDTTDAIGALGKQERQSYGAQFAEVAVDTGTGEVRVRRMLGMFAAGRIVNPLTARSQLVGGMTMGLSMALHEEGARDEALGALVNSDFAGYHISAHADVPDIEADWVEDVDDSNPSGIKGVGEVGIAGTAAAIANAVWHATGVRHRALPVRLDRVLESGFPAAR